MSHTPQKTLLLVMSGFSAGGAEHVMIILANNLATQYDVHLLTFAGPGAFSGAVSPHIKVHMLDSPGLWRGGWRYFKAVKSIRPNLVLSTLTHINFFVLFFSILHPRVPVIVREATLPYYFAQHRFWGLIKVLYRVLYRRAFRVVAPSSVMINQLQGLTSLRPERFQRILNPVNFDVYTNLIFSTPDPVVTRFVSCGRLDPQKGYDRLIIALAAWKDRHDWTFDIFGDGPQRPVLEAMLTQYGLQDHVRLLGMDMQARYKYKNYDYFLLPSRVEGLPNVVLESLAQGTRVIATRDAGGIVDIAALADPDSVTIVGSMPEFVAAMDDAAQKENRFYHKRNFLDPVFALPQVIGEYQDLIEKAMQQNAHTR